MDHLQTIQQVFTGRFFRVPDYQRGYAWEPKHVADLLQDLELLDSGEEHYAGTLVLHKDKGAAGIMDQEGHDHAVYDIVDGQQRLTTIVMLLDCIRRALPGDQPLARGIRRTYVTTRNLDGLEQPRLTLNRDTREFFESSIIAERAGVEGPQIRSHELLSSAQRQMAGHLQNHPKRSDAWLLELYKKVTNGLRLTVYEVPHTSDVGVIFEVMNNRGKPLSEMEKVKNYLLYLTSKMKVGAARQVADRVNSTWAKIFEGLMAASAATAGHEDQMLRAHWLMTQEYRSKEWSGSDSIKARFSIVSFKKNPVSFAPDITRYLETLLQFSVAYCDLVSPNRTESYAEYRGDANARRRVQRASEKLARMRVLAGFLPLVGAVRLVRPGDSEILARTLEACERFAFRVYRFAGLRANAGQSGLFRMGHDVYSGALSPEAALERTASNLEYYAPEQAFRESLSKPQDWYHRGAIKYLLYEYEEHLADGRPVQLPWEGYARADKQDSIEHILPQTWTDPYWEASWSQQDAEILLHDLGNLSLTFSNSNYGNKSFPDKRGAPGAGPCYANASTFMERSLAKHEHWTPAECRARRDQIVAWVISRWGNEDTLTGNTIPPAPADISDDDEEPAA